MGKIMLILCVVFLLAVSSVQGATYYVSPGEDTIQPVRDAIRSVNSNMTEDIIVYLRGGIYWLTNTLVTFKSCGMGMFQHEGAGC
jgi:hypothetical protein